jgi:hypothetical protein
MGSGCRADSGCDSYIGKIVSIGSFGEYTAMHYLTHRMRSEVHPSRGNHLVCEPPPVVLLREHHVALQAAEDTVRKWRRAEAAAVEQERKSKEEASQEAAAADLHLGDEPR